MPTAHQISVVLWLKIGLIAMLLFALRPTNHYDFYQILRLASLGLLSFLAYASAKNKDAGWAWTFATFAVLYNPLLPLKLERHTWELANISTAMMLGISILPRQLPSRTVLKKIAISLGVLAISALGFVLISLVFRSHPLGKPALSNVVEASHPTDCELHTIHYPIFEVSGTGEQSLLRMGQSTTYSYLDSRGVRNFSNRAPANVACRQK